VRAVNFVSRLRARSCLAGACDTASLVACLRSLCEALVLLNSVLPGLRDVRSPLAAGYIWLLALYIAFEPLVPKKSTTGIWATFSHLHRTFSALGVGLAVSFVAYLVGSISLSLFAFLAARLRRYAIAFGSRRATRKISRPDSDTGVLERVSGLYGETGLTALRATARTRVVAIRNALRPHIREEYGLSRRAPLWAIVEGGAVRVDDALRPLRAILTEGGWPRERLMSLHERPHRDNEFAAVLQEVIAASIVPELRLARTSLIGDQQELFSEVDRLQAEAEFRTAIAPPLVAIAFVLAWRAVWWSFAIPIVAAILLTITGRNQSRRANDSLLDALRIGRAKVPSLDQVDEIVATLRATVPESETKATESKVVVEEPTEAASSRSAGTDPQ
jgi:hypothetical protein